MRLDDLTRVPAATKAAVMQSVQEAFKDRSRRPYRHANKLPYQVERTIVGLKKEHAGWGAPKIRDKIIRAFPMIKAPATSTVHAVLDRHGLVKRRKRRRYRACGTELTSAHEVNGLWGADFKGEFMLGNKRYCYPLTISDYRSRYLLACEGLESVRSEFAFSVFERVFKDFGLPGAIRTDNGAPFASGNALFGLSKLAVWWLRLGIRIERIKPGNSQQNGRHERMHLTLKKSDQARLVQLPAAAGAVRPLRRDLQSRAATSGAKRRLSWRPLYTFSARLLAAAGARVPVSRPLRPGHKLRPHLHRQAQDQLEQGIRCQIVGLREVDDQIWLVSFLDYDLGFFDKDEGRIEPGPNPFAPEQV